MVWASLAGRETGAIAGGSSRARRGGRPARVPLAGLAQAGGGGGVAGGELEGLLEEPHGAGRAAGVEGGAAGLGEDPVELQADLRPVRVVGLAQVVHRPHLVVDAPLAVVEPHEVDPAGDEGRV